MLPNPQQATSALMQVRDCRSSYSRRQGSGVMLDLNSSRLERRRLRRPRTVERVAEALLPTELGEFRIIGYRSITTNEEFVVLARGELGGDRATLVRVHSQCLTGDVFGLSQVRLWPATPRGDGNDRAGRARRDCLSAARRTRYRHH